MVMFILQWLVYDNDYFCSEFNTGPAEPGYADVTVSFFSCPNRSPGEETD